MDQTIVIEELRRVATEMNADRVSRSQFTQRGRISSAAVEQAFGSWNEAIVAAGLKPWPQGGTPRDEGVRAERIATPPTEGQAGRIPDDALLDDLVRLAAELGRRPSGNQVAARGKYNPSVYQRRWGSLAAAYGAALKRRDRP